MQFSSIWDPDASASSLLAWGYQSAASEPCSQSHDFLSGDSRRAEMSFSHFFTAEKDVKLHYADNLCRGKISRSGQKIFAEHVSLISRSTKQQKSDTRYSLNRIFVSNEMARNSSPHNSPSNYSALDVWGDEENNFNWEESYVTAFPTTRSVDFVTIPWDKEALYE